MTMIAFATHEDHAEILADSMTYNRNGRHNSGRASKVSVFTNIDAAVMARGDQILTALWQYDLACTNNVLETFDHLVEHAAARLPAAWDARCNDIDGDEPMRTTVYLVGFSPSAGRFQAFGTCTELVRASRRERVSR